VGVRTNRIRATFGIFGILTYKPRKTTKLTTLESTPVFLLRWDYLRNFSDGADDLHVDDVLMKPESDRTRNLLAVKGGRTKVSANWSSKVSVIQQQRHVHVQ
jgi:hypothetical protein